MNVQDEIKALKQRIAELEELAKEEQEFPKNENVYWFINTEGETNWYRWHGTEVDNNLLSFGNVFKTKDEAKFQVEKLKVEAELRKFSKPFEYGKFNYSLIFDIDGDNFRTDFTGYCPPQGAIYFESEEKAQQAVSTVGADRIKKYIFGVED